MKREVNTKSHHTFESNNDKVSLIEDQNRTLTDYRLGVLRISIPSYYSSTQCVGIKTSSVNEKENYIQKQSLIFVGQITFSH